LILYLFLVLLLLIEAGFIFKTGTSKGHKILFAVLSFIQLFIISALRSSNIGNDTQEYLELFQSINLNKDIALFSKRFELGYIILNKIIYLFSHESQSLLIITSFIILFMFIRFIYKTSSNIWLSIYLFVTLMFYYFILSGIRQALAMGIIVTSYEYLKKRKIIPYMLLIFLASLFHNMAIIYIFIYPFSYLKFSIKKIFIILSCGVIAFLAFDWTINLVLQYFPKYLYYIGSQEFEGNKIANVINAIIPALILLFGCVFKYHKQNTNTSQLVYDDNISSPTKKPNFLKIFSRLNSDNPQNNGFELSRSKVLANESHLLSFLVLIGMLFSFISIRASVIDRVYSYFAIFSIIYIPNVINTIKRKESRLLITFLIMVIALLYNLTIFIYRPEWHHVFPYEFFWQAQL
jgi:hypothetical protein